MTNHEINSERSKATEHLCQAIRELLPAYATSAALGTAPQSTYPQVAVHLEHCRACRADLDELMDLTIAAYTGQVEVAPSYPRVDLSFLHPHVASSPHEQPWLLDALGRLIITFSEALLNTLRQPTLAGAARGQLLYSYVQAPGSLPNLDVTIEVFAEDAAGGLGCVRVGVEATTRDPLDQAGSQIVLRAGDAVWHGETDELGGVTFASIPLELLPQLRVEITPRS